VNPLKREILLTFPQISISVRTPTLKGSMSTILNLLPKRKKSTSFGERQEPVSPTGLGRKPAIRRSQRTPVPNGGVDIPARNMWSLMNSEDKSGYLTYLDGLTSTQSLSSQRDLTAYLQWKRSG